jgi:Protein of unknown function (DUF3592)
MATIVILMFFVLGFNMLLENIILVRKSTKANNWPTTIGNLQSLSLLTKEIHSPRYSITHQVKVTYNYFICGEMYTGNCISFGYRGGDNLASQQELMEKLRSNSTIFVRYNPKDTRISTLSFGVHGSIKQDIVAAFIVINFTLCMALSYFSPTILSGVLLVCGSIIFICVFIIWIVINYSTDNTIIKNIRSCN